MGRKLEDTDPAKARRILEKMVDPLREESLSQIARDEDVQLSTIKALFKRNEHVLTACLPLKDGDDEVPETFEQFQPMLRRTAWHCLNVTKDEIKNSTPAQRGVLGGISLDKAFILEGRDTMKISVLHEHRYALDGISQLIAGERERRALPEFIEGETEE